MEMVNKKDILNKVENWIWERYKGDNKFWEDWNKFERDINKEDEDFIDYQNCMNGNTGYCLIVNEDYKDE